METVPGSDPATSGSEANVQFSGHTQDKATKAKVHLESYYSNLLTQFQVRNLPAIDLYYFILNFTPGGHHVTYVSAASIDNA